MNSFVFLADKNLGPWNEEKSDQLLNKFLFGLDEIGLEAKESIHKEDQSDSNIEVKSAKKRVRYLNIIFKALKP